MKQKTLRCESEQELFTAIKDLFHAGAARMHRNHFGPKIYTDLQRVSLLILRVRSGLSYERFCHEYLPESKWPEWLGLQELPSPASVWRWASQLDMKMLRRLNQQLLATEQPATLAIDGTGVDSWRQSRHYERRVGENGRDFAKVDILVDTDSLLVHDWSLLVKPRHDAHVAKSLLRRLRTKSTVIIGDKGYDAEELYMICEETGNRFYAPLRNAPRSDEPPERLGWHKKRSHIGPPIDYHRRSLVESTIRSLKARIGALSARLHHMKKREFAWHVLARNIELQISFLLRSLEMLVRFAHHA